MLSHYAHALSSPNLHCRACPREACRVTKINAVSSARPSEPATHIYELLLVHSIAQSDAVPKLADPSSPHRRRCSSCCCTCCCVELLVVCGNLVEQRVCLHFLVEEDSHKLDPFGTVKSTRVCIGTANRNTTTARQLSMPCHELYHTRVLS